MDRPAPPPFTKASAARTARMIEGAWNSRDGSRLVLACTLDRRWRHRTNLIQGRDASHAFLVLKGGDR